MNTGLADPLPSVRDCRLSLGLSPEEAADALRIPAARLRAIEAGKEQPTESERRTLCALYRIGGDELDRALSVARRKPRRPRGGIVEMRES